MTDPVLPTAFQEEHHARKPSRLTGLGYFALFLVAIVFFSVGATTLRVMDASVQKAKQQAAEELRPANISLIKLLAADCATCYDVSKLTNTIEQNTKVNITNVQTVNTTSPEGKSLIERYKLQRAPAFILQGEVEKLLKALPQMREYGKQQDKDFVGNALPAPYMAIADGKIRGEFDVTYITEKQCTTCYDPSINRNILAKYGMIPRSEKTVDRLDVEGQQLVKQYSLVSTPTVLLSGDMKAYSGFDNIWKNVGTIESDGTYIFRTGQEQMGTYYDLASKKVVEYKNNNTSTNTSP